MHQKATTPESSHSITTNGLNDYFTYICENQSNRPQTQQQQNYHSEEDQQIPQIRLAPPTMMNQHEQSTEEGGGGGAGFTPTIEDNVSLHVPTTPSSHKQTDVKEPSTLSTSIAMLLDEIFFILFPTLANWSSKTTFSKLSSLVAVPLVLIFTLTLPIAESDDIKVDDIEVVHGPTVEESILTTPQVIVIGSAEDDNHAPPLHQKSSYLTVPSLRSLSEMLITEEEEDLPPLVWCRWLVAVQAICATTFVTSVMACKFNLF